MGNNCHICSFKCYGVDNYFGSCCSLENRDYIIGPHLEYDKFLSDLSIKFGRIIEHEEVFINYEEGSKLFPEKPSWQNPLNYPSLRINLDSEKKFCIFYNEQLKGCSVYEIRPKICRNYECDYLQNNSWILNKFFGLFKKITFYTKQNRKNTYTYLLNCYELLQ